MRCPRVTVASRRCVPQKKSTSRPASPPLATSTTPAVTGSLALRPIWKPGAGTFATRSSVIRPDYSNEALVTVEGDGPPIILMVDLTGASPPVVIAAPSPGAVPLAGSHAAGAVLFRAEAGPVSRLLLAEAGRHAAPRELSRINAHLEGIALGTWKRVAYPVTDPEGKVADRSLESCVLLPPGFDPAAPPPLVVEVYPDVGPFCPSDGAAMAYPDPDSAYLWVGKGFAYTRLATPKELIRTEDGPIAGLDEVVDAGVSALVAEGFADPDRLTLYGFSQGGVSALYVAAKSPRFRAVIAKNSWADMFSHYFSGSGIYAYLYESFGAFLSYDSVDGSDFGFGRTPFEDPDAYIRNSPVYGRLPHVPVRRDVRGAAAGGKRGALRPLLGRRSRTLIACEYKGYVAAPDGLSRSRRRRALGLPGRCRQSGALACFPYPGA